MLKIVSTLGKQVSQLAFHLVLGWAIGTVFTATAIATFRVLGIF